MPGTSDRHCDNTTSACSDLNSEPDSEMDYIETEPFSRGEGMRSSGRFNAC
ncbi:hypothetical protein HET73_04350 [Wolbachia endosymbiont of Atemnus politus]|uniref:hypothetical protein n=1 Tax=Wolbachia endosymbiont of Atemnus politus TaxID=2682840 RepID=UPI001572F04C|nr:hypothetical protein [Wolbachia endosymbiont of Atemnus politus]NSM56665.1 hypothetical protein [Wolbachia endosymbiont of Atemnus politus]